MTIVLATAWRPRGELARFFKLLPQLENAYSGIIISLPPEVDQEVVNSLQNLSKVTAVVTPDWSWGRFIALESALKLTSTHLQYADFDRLLRWVETRPDEWMHILDLIQGSDCLIVGRTDRAYRTHPEALVQTEAISNQVISYLLGQKMDVSAGSKGFSRKAAECIVANCSPGHALGTDGEWPITLKRAGFRVDFVTVEGLDWESADRYSDQAADLHDQQKAAELYDADAENWSRRVGVALEIIQSGLEAEQRFIGSTKSTKIGQE